MRILIAAVLAATAALSQPAPAPYYEDVRNIPVSPEIHADRTVSFRLFAPKRAK